ncbi:MAG: hypothetical protein U9P72_01390 [Campylobacterota bacterium]|nr:hypothetical protein [Campylobacterota bacterium]
MRKILLSLLLFNLVLSQPIGYEFLDALKAFEDDKLSNDKQARENLVKLASTDKNSAFLLGYYYKTPKYKNVNIKLSFSYYLQSAKLGEVDAMLITGWNYYKGKGVDYNMKQAKYWLEKAAIAGDKEAEAMLGFIF